MIITIFFSLTLKIFGEKIYTHINPWFNGIVVIEEYLYEKNEYDNIIVGSSLAKTLPINCFSDKTYNLSIAGLNSNIGIETILRKGARPKLVLIEYNRILVNRNLQFEEVINNRFFNFLKANLGAFRTKNQPIRYLAQFVLHIKDKIKFEVNRQFSLFEYPSFSISNSNIDIIQENTEAIDENVFNRRVEYFLNKLEMLKRLKIDFVLFKMPSKSFEDSIECKNLEELVLAWAISNNIIVLGDFEGSYETTDGAHLTTSSAAALSKHFNKEIESLKLLD